MKCLKVLVVGDLHGQHEKATNAYNEFIRGEYDKLIFLGDYVDSWDRSNEDIFNTVITTQAIKSKQPNDVVLLIGNHDAQYMYHTNDNRGQFTCDGFRPEAFPNLKFLFNVDNHLYQFAYQIGNYLFTHAGVQEKWFFGNLRKLSAVASIIECDVHNVRDVAHILNAVNNTYNKAMLFEVGPERGGKKIGGPAWVDREELIKNPLRGLHQIVGHTPCASIHRVETFEGQKWDDTSVTFCDVLGHKEHFLTLNIPLQ